MSLNYDILVMLEKPSEICFPCGKRVFYGHNTATNVMDRMTIKLPSFVF